MLKRNLVHSPIPPTRGLPKPAQDIPLWRDEDFTPDVGDGSSEQHQGFNNAESWARQDLVLPGRFQGCPQSTPTTKGLSWLLLEP